MTAQILRPLRPDFWLPHKKPQGKVKLREGHELVPNTRVWLFNDYAPTGPVDFIADAIAASTGSFTKTFHGLSLDSDQNWLRAPSTGIAGSFTAIVKARYISSTLSRFIFGSVDDTDFSWGLYYSDSNNRWECYAKSGIEASVALGPQTPFFDTVAMTYDQVQVRGFLNGAFIGLDILSGAVTDRAISFNRWNNLSGVRFEYDYCYLSDRAYPDEEVIELMRRPYQIFEPATDTIFIGRTPDAPTGVVMNQFQGPNLGADLYNGTFQ